MGECKGCNPYCQLLCGMMQVPSAVHTLHTHSMAAYRHSTGECNIPVATQWLGQRLCYILVQLIGLCLFDSLKTLLKANQVLLAHIDLSTCIKYHQTYTHYFSLWCTLVALWQHPIFQPQNVKELLSLTIITYLGGKNTISYHTKDLVGAAVNIQNPPAYVQTLFSKPTAYYNLIPTNYFYLE